MRVACVQTDVAYRDPARNTTKAVEHMLALKGHDLVVFPEAYLTGYVVGSASEAQDLAIDLDAESALIADLVAACAETGAHTVVGAIGRDGDRIVNSALLISPDGTVQRYDKTHLPYLGVDRFVSKGDRLSVFETAIGRIGLLVCYDLRVPEAARTLALMGADVIVLPTNWPEGAEMTPAHVAPTRALENRVYVATCNRIGTEGGVTFIGQSGIYGVVGQELAKAGTTETVISAELDLSLARQKRTVIRPGEYELDVMGSRRPDLYGSLSGK